jgi:hypothetical protein
VQVIFIFVAFLRAITSFFTLAIILAYCWARTATASAAIGGLRAPVQAARTRTTARSRAPTKPGDQDSRPTDDRYRTAQYQQRVVGTSAHACLLPRRRSSGRTDGRLLPARWIHPRLKKAKCSVAAGHGIVVVRYHCNSGPIYARATWYLFGFRF